MKAFAIGPALAAALLGLAAASVHAQDAQVGARAKALGGAGTAFEEDPQSIWLNPAGTAAQPGGFALSYQTYIHYEERGDPPDDTLPGPEVNDPIFIPSFVGVVLQVGSPELPQAVGICLATPYHVLLPFRGPNPVSLPPSEVVVSDQTFHRLRFSYAIDFALRPVGEDGFFSHVAVGLGADLTFARMESAHYPGDFNSRDNDLGLSGGAGVLMGLYDNGQSMRVSLGIAYQAPATYDLAPKSRVVPFFDWPQQVQVGLAFHLMERLPLRAYLEAQWTDWKAASKDSRLAGIEGFESSLGLSAGGEYRIEVSPSVGLLLRAGIRYYDAPWKHASETDLPAWGEYQLFIDTRAGKFVLFSFGFGLSWGYKEGTQDSLDVAFEIGGDAPAISFSYTFQF